MNDTKPEHILVNPPFGEDDTPPPDLDPQPDHEGAVLVMLVSLSALATIVLGIAALTLGILRLAGVLP